MCNKQRACHGRARARAGAAKPSGCLGFSSECGTWPRAFPAPSKGANARSTPNKNAIAGSEWASSVNSQTGSASCCLSKLYARLAFGRQSLAIRTKRGPRLEGDPSALGRLATRRIHLTTSARRPCLQFRQRTGLLVRPPAAASEKTTVSAPIVLSNQRLRISLALGMVLANWLRANRLFRPIACDHTHASNRGHRDAHSQSRGRRAAADPSLAARRGGRLRSGQALPCPRRLRTRSRSASCIRSPAPWRSARRR